MQRTRELRLQLFDRHVTELIGESASRASWKVSWSADEGDSTNEPDREALRSWLSSVRGLDAPNEDVQLDRILDDIDDMSTSEVTHRRTADLRERLDRARTQPSLDAVITGPNGVMTPRDCFEDLVVANRLHHDHEREARLGAMPPAGREIVRSAGWFYALELGGIATWAQAAGREDETCGYLFQPWRPEERRRADGPVARSAPANRRSTGLARALTFLTIAVAASIAILVMFFYLANAPVV